MTLDRVDQKSAITFLNVFLTIIIIKTNKLGTQKAEWIKSLLYKMFLMFSQVKVVWYLTIVRREV